MKKFLGLATILGLGLVINGSKVKADEEYVTIADKNYSISVEATKSAGAGLYMKLGGTDYVNDEKTNYYVYFSNDANVVPTDKVTIEDECAVSTNPATFPSFKSVFNEGEISISNDWYMLNGFNYAYVVKQTEVEGSEGTYYHCEFSSKAIEVKKPELEPIGQRYQYFVFSKDKKISVFPYFPHFGEMGSHKIITKIGLINDKDLLKKLSKSESGSMEELLAYAKTTEGKTYTYLDSDSFEMDLQDFTVTNGAYYYIYSTYENSDGVYRDLSDVTIVMGYSDMLVNEVKWDNSNNSVTPTKKEEIVNPKTGIEKPYILVATAFILLATGCLICLKKIKFFSK